MGSRGLPAPSAVAFDLDGTLVDTVPARLKAWVQALQEAGMPASEPEVSALIGSDGKYVARESARAAGRVLDAARAEAIDRRQGEIYDAVNTRPRPLPGAREILKVLDTRSIPWAIATSSRHAQVRASVKALRLPRPPTIIDGSHVENAKPAPDLLLKAARELRVRPQRCWYIGDSTWDMHAAKGAKMVAVGVIAGSAVGANDLRAAGATIVCKTLHEIIDLLPRP